MRRIDIVSRRSFGALDTFTTRVFDSVTGEQLDDVTKLTIVMESSGCVYATGERHNPPVYADTITETFLVHSIRETATP